MQTDVNGRSTCPIGAEAYEFFTTRSGDRRVQYDYRSPDGVLFSVIAKNLDEAREARDRQFNPVPSIRDMLGRE